MNSTKTFISSILPAVVGYLLMINIASAQIKSDSIKNGNVLIYYQTTGEGKPILLLSGGPGWSVEYMKPVCEELSKSYKCILIEQRGIRNSTVPVYDTSVINFKNTIEDIEFLRKHLKIKEWTVLGHSYGGALASGYAATFPTSVSSLILVETAGLNFDLFSYIYDNSVSRLLPSDLELVNYWYGRVKTDAEYAWCEQIKAFMPAYFFDRKNSILFNSSFTPEWLSLKVFRLIYADVTKNKIDFTKSARQFTKPVLIIYGRQSNLGEAVPIYTSQTYPNAKLKIIERCGHFPWVENSKLFNEIITEFMLSIK